jgi:Mn-dependent DtxR family transcriptional regulator
LILEKKKGSVRSLDVAEQMNVKKPSVSNAIKLLKEGGFLTMDGDKLLHLTELGREVAETICERHCILTEGLIYLGVDPEIAEQDACLLEHDISSESFEKLKERWENLKKREVQS